MIALLGATGFTGRLVAAELAARRLPHRLGARNPDRLAALPRAGERETFVVDVGEPARLDAFLAGTEVLINTVGPFRRLSMPVVEAAVRNHVAYVDCTGEPDFMAAVYERFADAPVAVVPACGVDAIPGDLSAAIAVADLGGPANEVAVHYDMAAVGASRGTLRTIVDMMGRTSSTPLRRRRVAFPDGVRQALEWPFGDGVSVRRHAGAAAVVTTIAVPGALAGLAERAIPVVARVGRPGLSWVVGRLPEGPRDSARHRSRVRVMAEAIGVSGRRAVITECRDVYGLTARFLVEAAGRLRGTGAMAPAQALEPIPFFQAVSGQSDRGSFAWRRVETDS